MVGTESRERHFEKYFLEDILSGLHSPLAENWIGTIHDRCFELFKEHNRSSCFFIDNYRFCDVPVSLAIVLLAEITNSFCPTPVTCFQGWLFSRECVQTQLLNSCKFHPSSKRVQLCRSIPFMGSTQP